MQSSGVTDGLFELPDGIVLPAKSLQALMDIEKLLETGENLRRMVCAQCNVLNKFFLIQAILNLNDCIYVIYVVSYFEIVHAHNQYVSPKFGSEIWQIRYTTNLEQVINLHVLRSVLPLILSGLY